MAEFTPWREFSSLSQDDPGAGRSWADLSRARDVDDDYASSDLFGSVVETYNLEYYNPQAAALVPQVSEISRLEFQVNVEAFGAAASAYYLEDIRVMGGTPAPDVYIPAGRTTLTIARSLAQWGITQQQAQDFLYSGSSNEAFSFRIREAVAADTDDELRVYWTQCRVEFTRPPNQPRTAFIGVF